MAREGEKGGERRVCRCARSSGKKPAVARPPLTAEMQPREGREIEIDR